MSKRVATYQLTAENFDQQDEEGHTKDESVIFIAIFVHIVFSLTRAL